MSRVTFRNFGVGGDLAYNALQRLSDVVATHPKKIVVFIGGNDVLRLVSTKARRFFRISKQLPRDPSVEWFRENLRAIVLRLKAETSADHCALFVASDRRRPSIREPLPE